MIEVSAYTEGTHTISGYEPDFDIRLKADEDVGSERILIRTIAPSWAEVQSLSGCAQAGNNWILYSDIKEDGRVNVGVNVKKREESPTEIQNGTVKIEVFVIGGKNPDEPVGDLWVDVEG